MENFVLGNGEPLDSTLHIASQANSESANEGAQRIKSAHFPSQQRADTGQSAVRGDYYSDANRLVPELSASTFQRQTKNRVSPVNTVFQKLANPQTLSQQSS